MSTIDALAIAAAERLERTATPASALAAWRTLAPRLSSPDAQTRALAGALRCATRAADREALAGAARAWQEGASPGGDHERDVLRACKALAAHGDARAAADLAAAEATRQPRARVSYLEGRCRAIAGDPAAAAAAFARAEERARKEGVVEIGLAARARRSAITGEPCAPPSGDEIARGAPHDVLAACGAALRAPSRFARATALAALEELAKTAAPEVRVAAVALGARHADRLGASLTPMEADRVAPLLRLWPREAEATEALARLAAAQRIAAAKGDARDALVAEAAERAAELRPILAAARALLASPTAEPPVVGESAPAAVRLAAAGLALVAATRGGKDDRARSALADARAALHRSPSVPAPLWTGLAAALTARAVRDEAIALALSALARAPAPEPLRARLADALSDALAERGRALAERGERDAAIAALRRARDLAYAQG